MKKFLIATLSSAIGMWLLAGLWHQVINAQFYASETQAAHQGTGIIFIAYLVLGLIMAYIYPLGYKGNKPAVEGLKFGFLMGLLWVFPHELAMAGAHDTSVLYVLKNAVWHTVEQGFGGIIIGLVYGKIHTSK